MYRRIWDLTKNQAKVGVNSKKKLEKVRTTALLCFLSLSLSLLADAEKLEYESDSGGRGKKKAGAAVTKKRPASSPPPTDGKKKKR
jgi:hypothetical protein